MGTKKAVVAVLFFTILTSTLAFVLRSVTDDGSALDRGVNLESKADEGLIEDEETGTGPQGKDTVDIGDETGVDEESRYADEGARAEDRAEAAGSIVSKHEGNGAVVEGETEVGEAAETVTGRSKWNGPAEATTDDRVKTQPGKEAETAKTVANQLEKDGAAKDAVNNDEKTETVETVGLSQKNSEWDGASEAADGNEETKAPEGAGAVEIMADGGIEAEAGKGAKSDDGVEAAKTVGKGEKAETAELVGAGEETEGGGTANDCKGGASAKAPIVDEPNTESCELQPDLTDQLSIALEEAIKLYTLMGAEKFFEEFGDLMEDDC